MSLPSSANRLSLALALHFTLAATAFGQYVWDDECLPDNRWYVCLDSPEGPKYNNWNQEPIDESCPPFPGAANTVDLGIFNVRLVEGTATVISLTSDGLFSIEGPHLELFQTADITHLQLAGGGISAGISISTTVLEWFGGQMGTFDGSRPTVTVDDLAILDAGVSPNGANDLMDCDFIANGLTLWGNHDLRMNNGSTFTNNDRFEDYSNGLISGNALATFVNNGEYVKEVDGLDPSSSTIASSVIFNNLGDVRVTAGNALTIESNGTNTGRLFVEAGGLLNFNTAGANTYVLGAGTELQTFGDGFIRKNGGGTLVLGIPLEVGNFGMHAGTLSGTNLTASQVEWTGGDVSGATLTADSSLTMSDTAIKTISFFGTVNNNSSGTWNDNGQVNLLELSTFHNAPGAILNINGGGRVIGDALWENEGELVKAAGNTTTFTSDILFHNKGNAVVRVNQGTLRIESDGLNDPGAKYLLVNPLATLEFAQYGNRLFEMNSGGDTIRGPGLAHMSGGDIFVPAGQKFEVDNFRSSGGQLSGPGYFAAQDFEWLGGTLSDLGQSGGGNSRVESDFEIANFLSKTLDGGALDNLGDALWRETGDFRLYNGAEFNNKQSFTAQCEDAPEDLRCPMTGGANFRNHAGATFHASGNAVIFSGGANGTLINDGDMTTTANLIDIDVPFLHSGSLETLTDTGLVKIQEGGSASGTFQTLGGSTIQVAAKPFTLEDGAEFLGSGRLNLASGELNVAAGASVPVSCNFLMSGGKISGEGEIDLQGASIDWYAGTMEGPGTTTASGAEFRIMDAPGQPNTINELRNRTLNLIAATARFEGSGDLYLNQGAELNILFGGRLLVEGPGDFAHGSGDPGIVRNNGFLEINADTVIGNNVRLHNHLETIVNNTLQLSGGGDFTDGQFTGSGTMRLASKTCDFSNTDVGALTLEITGGTANVTGDSHAQFVQMSASAAAIDGPADFALDALDWQAGAMRGAGSTTVDSMLIDGFAGKSIDGRTLYNDGFAQWLDGTITMSNGAVLHNRDRFEIVGNDRIQTGTGGGGTVINDGTFVKLGGVGQEAIIFPPFEHRGGEVRSEAGNLRFAGPFNQTGGITRLGVAGGAIEFSQGLTLAGGLLIGAGSARGDILNPRGRVRPGNSPGQMDIDGDYGQETDGVLEIELAGPTPGSEHDVLAMTGTATLDGTLEVQLTGGYVPQVGDTFEILTASSINGEFSRIRRVGFPGQLRVKATYNPDAVVIEIVERTPGQAAPGGLSAVKGASAYPNP